MMCDNTWILFDLDGTLTQSEEGIWNGVKYTADVMGFPQPEAATLRKFIGPPLFSSFQQYLGMTPEQATQAMTVYRERYTRLFSFAHPQKSGSPSGCCYRQARRSHPWYSGIFWS